VNNPKETPKGGFTASQGRLSRSRPLRSDGSHDSQMGGWASLEVAKGSQKQATVAQVGPSGSRPLTSDGSHDGQTGG
jgi:hypothetical protein